MATQANVYLHIYGDTAPYMAMWLHAYMSVWLYKNITIQPYRHTNVYKAAWLYGYTATEP